MTDELAGLDPLPRPSWARLGWPLLPDDDLTLALDPGLPDRAASAVAKANGKAAAPTAEEQRKAADNSLRAMNLIRAYRLRGHLAADIDPLGLERKSLPEDLDASWHGLTDPEQMVYIGGSGTDGSIGDIETITVRDLVAVLRRNYCGHVGIEYMHINDSEERRFLQAKFEGRGKDIEFTRKGKIAILDKLIQAEQFEKFLAKKYVGTKRFGIEGGEAAIPALESIIKVGGASGVSEIVVGMPHRGRLNVLANVMAKPYRNIFHEFHGGSSTPEEVGGSGDVKYHLGTSSDREFDGNKVHLSLSANPSHLEAVDPVVLGKVRALQHSHRDKTRRKVLPVLLHGDAAFAGQGVVSECFSFSGVPGYNTGGTIHFIVNNQVGFTTSPSYGRSSPYPSDVSKSVQAPIFHVNGDDPEAVVFATKVATEFRQKFCRDVVIDMWCYRRFGHNEADEPAFTQPLMYAIIRKHPSVASLYGDRLKDEGVLTADEITAMETRFVDRLEEEFQAASDFLPNHAEWFSGRWAKFGQPKDSIDDPRSAETGVAEKTLRVLARQIHTVPDGFSMHKRLARIIETRQKTIDDGAGIDWATAESLAFASIVAEASDGHGIRLSGQDSRRGAFSQRHLAWTDQKTGQVYIPIASLGGYFEPLDSPLSEYGVLGFEYGFASVDPCNLVIWEAQFGDFANGAQIIQDQFIAASEAKWLRVNGLVMLLPHGYEGQGPEHSSARLERFLQLCAEDNMQVANCTTPANYFHILRRQVMRDFRKPLVIMTPKSLLRLKDAVSMLADMAEGTRFERCLPDRRTPDAKKVKRLLLCSGKVYYDLADKRDELERDDVYILRVEQLYPFPSDEIARYSKMFPNLDDIIWVQEEPMNAGGWTFVAPYIEEVTGRRPVYVGRAASAATATGLARRHAAEQAKLVAEAMGLSKSEVRAVIRSSLKSGTH